MSDLNTLKAFPEQTPIGATMVTGPVFEAASGALGIQAGFFRRMETATTEFLQRQRAGCDAGIGLMDSLRSAKDPWSIMTSQQAFLGATARRMLEDLAGWHAIGLDMMTIVGRAWAVEGPAPENAQEQLSSRRTARGVERPSFSEQRTAAQ